MNVIKVLALTKYGRLGASSRLRSLQYLPLLEQADFEVTVQSLIPDSLLKIRYERGGYGLSLLKAYGFRLFSMLRSKKFNVIWIEKEALPWWPLWMESALLNGVPYILDYDDAIFHNYDQHANACVRRLYGKKLDSLMSKAALVIGGNNYLAQRARNAGAKWVELLPTVIDLAHYPHRQSNWSDPNGREIVTNSSKITRIVWIGSPSQTKHLKLIGEPLRSLSKHQDFILRVIGGSSIDLPGVQVETVPWTEDSEFESISVCQFGVMPLSDSLWERGKCGYKLIQYMACGLPTIASKVGANPEIVCHGKDGFLADTLVDWATSLEKLLENSSLRTSMGAAGRLKVENEYCIQKTVPRLIQLLNTVAKRH